MKVQKGYWSISIARMIRIATRRASTCSQPFGGEGERRTCMKTSLNPKRGKEISPSQRIPRRRVTKPMAIRVADIDKNNHHQKNSHNKYDPTESTHRRKLDREVK